MKKYLVIIVAILMLSSVNVYAQTMSQLLSKYGYTMQKGYTVKKINRQKKLKLKPTLISKPIILHKNIIKSKNYSVDSIIKSVNIYYENDYYHYGEYTSSLPGFNSASHPTGSYADGEHIGFHGWGISFQNILTKQIPIWYKASYSYLPGSGTYDEPGPVSISHSSNMTRYGFRLGYVFHIGNRIALIPNFGYQWVNWHRNLPFNGSTYYHLNYYMLGLKAYYIPPVLNNKLWIEAEGYYLNGINDTVNGTAYTQYYYTYIVTSDNMTHFIMAPKAGYIFGFKIGYQLYKIDNLSINPYIGIRYEQNKMGRSNINNIYYTNLLNGVTFPEQYVEPSDQYNQLFLQFGLKFGF